MLTFCFNERYTISEIMDTKEKQQSILVLFKNLCVFLYILDWALIRIVYVISEHKNI